VSRLPAPPSAKVARRAMTKALGRPAAERMPETYFELVRATMRMPGWKLAMTSHLNLALHSGKARPENLLTDDELRSFEVPVRFVMGDDDVYGGPDVVERAAALMPAARVEVMPGGHAPFLDDPGRCAELIRTA
jgi:pimeloyl-[acyl-carrier protein] methyl ester esterase